MGNRNYEDAVKKARNLWTEIKGFFTDNMEEYNEFYKEPNGDIYLVSDANEVFKAFVKDYEDNFKSGEEDIIGFLDRHGIKWL